MAESDEDEDDATEAADASFQATYDAEVLKLKWMSMLTKIISGHSNDPKLSRYCQQATDQMFVDACERMGRILRSDLSQGDADELHLDQSSTRSRNPGSDEGGPVLA